MSCRARREEIALLVGGELTASGRTAVEEHLKTCPACRELAAALRDDRRALASLATEDPPAESLVRIREGIREGIRTEGGAEDRPRRRLWLALAAAIVAAALGLELWTGLHERGDGTGTPDAPRVARDRAPADRPAGEPPTAPDPSPDRSPGPDSDPAPDPNPDPSPDPSWEGEPDRLATTRPPERAPDPAAARAEPSAADGSITIRIVSDDPDIVFYWLTDEPKESTDEATV